MTDRRLRHPLNAQNTDSRKPCQRKTLDKDCGCLSVLDEAERQGFEPWVPLRVLRFSRPVQSATLPSLRGGCYGDPRVMSTTTHYEQTQSRQTGSNLRIIRRRDAVGSALRLEMRVWTGVQGQCTDLQQSDPDELPATLCRLEVKVLLRMHVLLRAGHPSGSQGKRNISACAAEQDSRPHIRSAVPSST